MNPYICKPGETVLGLGFDFRNRLASGETLTGTPTVTADTGITILARSCSGTNATANISIAANQADAELNLNFTVTGSAGSVRKATRPVWIRAASE